VNRLEAALRQAAADLTRYGRPWALVGGFAVSARTQPRFTRDVDVAVAVHDDATAEELVRNLVSDGYTILGTVEHDNGRLATVRLARPIEGVETVVDLLFASSGIEAELALHAEVLEIVPGLRLPVAGTGHLIVLKLLARDDESRPQDLSDLRELSDVATPDDWAVAGAATQLIMERGYNRGRDLPSLLGQLKTEADTP
jgi:predicted nucleotidyltransferase